MTCPDTAPHPPHRYDENEGDPSEPKHEVDCPGLSGLSTPAAEAETLRPPDPRHAPTCPAQSRPVPGVCDCGQAEQREAEAETDPLTPPPAARDALTLLTGSLGGVTDPIARAVLLGQAIVRLEDAQAAAVKQASDDNPHMGVSRLARRCGLTPARVASYTALGRRTFGSTDGGG